MSEAILLPTPAVSGPIRDYPSLISALRARVAQLGLTHLDVEEIAGLQGGYFSKLLARPGARCHKVLGGVSLPLVLAGLGVRLELVEDEFGGRKVLGPVTLPLVLAALGVKLHLVADDRPRQDTVEVTAALPEPWRHLITQVLATVDAEQAEAAAA